LRRNLCISRRIGDCVGWLSEHVMRHFIPKALRPPPAAIERPPRALRPPPAAIERPPKALRPPQAAIERPPRTLRGLLATIERPPRTLRGLSAETIAHGPTAFSVARIESADRFWGSQIPIDSLLSRLPRGFYNRTRSYPLEPRGRKPPSHPTARWETTRSRLLRTRRPRRREGRDLGLGSRGRLVCLSLHGRHLPQGLRGPEPSRCRQVRRRWAGCEVG